MDYVALMDAGIHVTRESHQECHDETVTETIMEQHCTDITRQECHDETVTEISITKFEYSRSNFAFRSDPEIRYSRSNLHCEMIYYEICFRKVEATKPNEM